MEGNLLKMEITTLMILTDNPTCINIAQKVTPTHSPTRIKQNTQYVNIPKAYKVGFKPIAYVIRIDRENAEKAANGIANKK